MPRKNYHHGDLKNALIKAGVEILAKDGVGALSLRSVARRAGVSHAAPYTHFVDKQALIAAISTEGYRKIFNRIEAAIKPYEGDPKRQLLEAAWAYLEFAMDDTEDFKISLSGTVEREKDYPALVEASHAGFASIVRLCGACQSIGIQADVPTDVLAVSLWSMVHGLSSLIVEGQISHTILERMSLRQLLVYLLNQIEGMDLYDEIEPTRSSQ